MLAHNTPNNQLGSDTSIGLKLRGMLPGIGRFLRMPTDLANWHTRLILCSSMRLEERILTRTTRTILSDPVP